MLIFWFKRLGIVIDIKIYGLNEIIDFEVLISYNVWVVLIFILFLEYVFVYF